MDKNFLTDRATQVRSGNELSDTINIHRVVPQGAALSPILSTICVNDKLDPKHQLTKFGLFADDTVYWTSAKTTNSAIKKTLKNNNKFSKLVSHLEITTISVARNISAQRKNSQ